jgi:molybdenum cofactor cytidylyltransferase
VADTFEIDFDEPFAAVAVEVNPRGSMAGVILSAGNSRRMGSPKALLRYQGETFLDRLIRVLSTVCERVVVVLGQDASAIQAGLSAHGGVCFAVNPDPERGMLSSLQCGLRMLPEEVQAIFFTPVDHPNISPATVTSLAEAFHAHRAPVTAPVYRGRRGHPVCITRQLAGELLELPIDAQAADVIHRHAAARYLIEVDDPGVIADIDDPDAYRALIASEGSSPKAAPLQ